MSKMINSSRGKNVGRAKQEDETNEIKLSKTTTTSSSRQWAGFKNPRIVRVSRSFGGKDRHSKVCTIRGLRDRRIRLSVPSAIQLYHLQDRLRLNQPSKVVEWLLDVTKDDIDNLPPLQIPPGDFTQFYQQTLGSHHELNGTLQSSSVSPFFNSNSKFVNEGITRINVDNEDSRIKATQKWNDWASMDSDSREKHKEAEGENTFYNNTTATDKQEYEGGNSSGSYIPQLSAHNFLPLVVNQFPFPAINNNLSYNWESPNLYMSQFGSQVLPSQVQYSHSCSTTHSSSSLPSFAHLMPTAFLPQYYPHHYVPSSSAVENDPSHINHFQLISSSSSNSVPDHGIPPFRFIHPFNMNSEENMKSSGTDATKLL